MRLESQSSRKDCDNADGRTDGKDHEEPERTLRRDHRYLSGQFRITTYSSGDKNEAETARPKCPSTWRRASYTVNRLAQVKEEGNASGTSARKLLQLRREAFEIRSVTERYITLCVLGFPQPFCPTGLEALRCVEDQRAVWFSSTMRMRFSPAFLIGAHYYLEEASLELADMHVYLQHLQVM